MFTISNDELLIAELTNETIEKMIYVIRGKKVMLDFELAKIYNYSTKDFNNQVKHNIERFDEDFRFQLTNDEFKQILRWKKSTSSWGGIRYLPYAFTEQGIYMLMTVLKGNVAVAQSKTLIRAFKQMKDYLYANNELIVKDIINNYSYRIDRIENQLETVMKNFKEESNFRYFLIMDGQRIEADIAYQSIYQLAKKSIMIIDNYVDIKTLQLLKVCSPNIQIFIFTDNLAKNKINAIYLEDFKKDTGISIKVKSNNNIIHDRYIIIDYESNQKQIYHCGASSKDAGDKVTTIIKIEDVQLYNGLIDRMIDL